MVGVQTSFNKVLVANRGEIARRILRTCREMGLGTVAVHSEADANAAFVRDADEAVLIGPAPSAESYLRMDAILDAARRTGAGAIHPGYGFLSENAGFAAACEAAGIVFIGPTSAAITAMGSKIAAKRLMASHGVPVVPGFDGVGLAHVGVGDDEFLAAAPGVGFPLLVKASAGGGGKGMRIVRRLADLPEALASARREAQSSFGDPALLIERYVDSPRHVEVQILGDAHGQVVHCFERECSIQRRHQKVLEESPSPALTPALRAAMGEAAVRAGKAIGYRSAGTVEFVLSGSEFFFLEVNTRLQVEHPVTEMVTGLDLVRLQIEIARGKPLPFRQEDLVQRGHAIEARLYAEDPDGGFLPQTGHLIDFHVPVGPGVRLDSGVETGDEVGIHYDPMLAKLVTYGVDRDEANARMARALRGTSIQGVTTNVAFLRRVIEHPAWQSGTLTTHFIADHEAALVRVPRAPEHITRALRIATATEARAVAGARTALASVLAGWRNNRFADPVERWRLGDETLACAYRLLADGCVMTRVGDSEAVVTLAAPDTGDTGDARDVRVSVDGHTLRARVVADHRTVYVHVDGEDFAFQRVPRFEVADAAADAGTCKAPMPGKVLAVRVQAGAEVEAGTALVVLEAMKMEHTLEAPRTGKVAEVLCQVGDVVAADQELVRLEG